jgi:hypothetical protein
LLDDRQSVDTDIAPPSVFGVIENKKTQLSSDMFSAQSEPKAIQIQRNMSEKQ